MKKQNGITLIALVITIVVLLILAGVSISMVLGDNGILTKAKESKTAMNDAATKEYIQNSLMATITEGLTKGYTTDEFNDWLKSTAVKGAGEPEATEDGGSTYFSKDIAKAIPAITAGSITDSKYADKEYTGTITMNSKVYNWKYKDGTITEFAVKTTE